MKQVLKRRSWLLGALVAVLAIGSSTHSLDARDEQTLYWVTDDIKCRVQCAGWDPDAGCNCFELPPIGGGNDPLNGRG